MTYEHLSVIANSLRMSVRMLRTAAHEGALAAVFNGVRGHGRDQTSSAQPRHAGVILEKPPPVGGGARRRMIARPARRKPARGFSLGRLAADDGPGSVPQTN